MRKPMIVGISALLGLACLLIGYQLGVNQVVQTRGDVGSLSRQLQDSELAVQDLEAQLIDARLFGDVQKNAADAARERMSGMHTQLENLQEEVTFYKSLMSPEDVPQGLSIQALELRRLNQGYEFELLLTQVALRRTYIGGEIRVDFIGRAQQQRGEVGDQVVKSFTELADEAQYPFKFRFRYFQDIKGQFSLPSDFEPERILVTASRSGEEDLQVSFPWTLEARLDEQVGS